MREAPALILAGVVGALLGAFYYGGLWLTVRTAVTSKHAALQFFASTLSRTALAVSGFFFVSRSHWERLPPCLLGFFLASVAFTRWAPPPRAKPSHRAEGATHASQS
jgi:F1F0 ATPase subunit 2